MDIHLTEDGPESIVVAVRGDLDLATADRLQASLDELLASVAVPRVGLDLSQVPFLDCTALRALSAIEQRAASRGLIIRLTAASPAVHRLLSLLEPPAGSTFLAEAASAPTRISISMGATAGRPTLPAARGALSQELLGRLAAP